MKSIKSLAVLGLISSIGALTFFAGCSSNSNPNPAAPAPVTVLQLVTATPVITNTVTNSPTVTPTNTPSLTPSDSPTPTITSTPVPPPACINGYFTTNQNLPVTLSNSTLNTLVTLDPNGDPLIFLFPGTPDHGAVYLTHSGYTNSITYVPNAGFSGTDSFAYSVYDQATQEYSTVQTMVITVALAPTATVTPTISPTITWTATNTVTSTFTPTPNATACATKTLFGPHDLSYNYSVPVGYMLFNPTIPPYVGGVETLWSIDVIPNLTSGNSVSLQCAVYDQITGDQLALSSPQSISGPTSAAVRFPVTPCTLIPGRTYLLACNIITATTGFDIGGSNIVSGLYSISSGASMPGNFTGSGATYSSSSPEPDMYVEMCP